MIDVALKGLFGRKLRTVLTAFAIVLGVAMVSGTYILTDTIKAAFNTVFTEVYKNTDAVISGKSAIGGSSDQVTPPSLPESLVGKVRALPDVALAEGGINDQGQLVGRDGKVIARGGAPALAFSVNPHGSQRFNPLELVEGRWPDGPHEIAIDKATADKEHFGIGDDIGMIARGPVELFHIVGIVRFGGLSSLGGATMAIFDLPTAQRIFDKVGEVDTIGAAAKTGVSPEQLVREIKPLLPGTAQVRTGQQEAHKASEDTSQFLDILAYILLAFGGVALFVGAFVIANTISITIAQRTRELATLRTLGASRRQVFWSVVLEAFVIGLLASITGLVLGIALAKGLNALFVSFGIDLPQTGTVFATRTVVVSLLVGVIITVLAALRPALRATRVEPIAAVREGAVLPKSRLARFGLPAALVTVGVSVALMVAGLFASGLSTKQALLAIGVGAVGFFLGVAMLAPKLVPTLARVLGWPATKISGVSGTLARANSIRNPSRTASTASAMMIGLALVTLVAVLAAGLKTTFERSVNELFNADYALTSQDGFTPTSIASERALEQEPNVEVVSGVRADSGQAFGNRISVMGVQPNVGKVMNIKWIAGGADTPQKLGDDGAFVAKSYAEDHDLSVGSPIELKTAAGKVLNLRLTGIFDPPKGGSPFGDITISSQLFDSTYADPKNLYAFVNTVGGVTDENTALLEQTLTKYPDAKIQTKSEFVKNQERGINILLSMLYLLLSLSIIVSLLGIVNTLVLTVFERTRELGMLRAIGMTRRQVRGLVLQESIITALLGAALGIPVGMVLAVMVGRAIEYPAFTIPWASLVVFVIAAIVAGMLAAILPALRAGRLNVLEALQYE